jgi:adenylosuccinate synthase
MSSRSSTFSSGSSVRRLRGYDHRVCAVLGGQWGDEGKGKLVDILAQQYDIIARFNGGSNAGHTLVVEGKKFAFHLLPCGMLYDDKVNIIGNGVVLHLPTMFKELEKLKEGGRWDEEREKARQVSTGHSRLLISNRAHLLFDFHQSIDGQQETSLKANNIGTTKKGIGPCYASKATRNGIRVGELLDFDRFKERLEALITALQRQYTFEVDIKQEIDKYQQYRDRIKVNNTAHTSPSPALSPTLHGRVSQRF